VKPSKHEARGVGASVTSPRSDLTTSAHDAPRLALSVSRGGRGIGDACEGATGRWVPCSALSIQEFFLETFRAGAMLC
jgi:hypothetical protein